MPILAWYGALAIGGLIAGGWAAGKVGDAAQETAKPIKWIVTGGVVYVGYKALKSSGAIK